MPFDVDAAKKEVQEKQEEEIEVETAYKWASRAIACFQLHAETELVKWLIKGEDYRHEALEHAALAKDGGDTLNAIEKEIEKHRTTVDDEAETEVEKVSSLEEKLIKLFRQDCAMPMYNRIKISQRVKSKLPMVTPGTRDNSILPAGNGGGASNSGITLDYSAINMGGIDNGVPFNHADDGAKKSVGFKAAFRNRLTNKVYVTGNWHNLDALPEEALTELDNLESGFVDSDGNFYTRRQAAQAAGLPPTHELDAAWLDGDYRNAPEDFRSLKNDVDDDSNKARGAEIGSREEGFAFRHNLDYGSTASLNAIIVKGNAKFVMDNAAADEFYEAVASYLRHLGYTVAFDVSETRELIHKADLVIGHSNGLRKLNRCRDDAKLIAIGAIPEKATNPAIIFANHPADEAYLKKCHYRNRYDYPIPEHFIFTDEMKLAISTATIELLKKAFPDWSQYNGDSQMYEQVAERPDAFTTPHFNLWNTYYAADDEYGLRSLSELKAILPNLASAAQKIYDNWIQDEDDDLNGGGICHLIADAMCDEMNKIGIECATVSYSIGEVHVAAVAKLSDGVFTIDIPPPLYETGGGYTWQKRPDVKFDPSYISITKESSDPDEFETFTADYVDDKLAAINMPQYSDPNMYEQISNPRNTSEPEFDIFETYFADDVEVTEEDDSVEAVDGEERIKQAFIKTAITYDSNPVIQSLIAIPEIKSVIEQHASGFVDKIVVTTPGADIAQTQQNIKPTSPGVAPITLQPISGNPYGHMWTSEDPTTHQKKPLDKIVRIDRVTDQYGTLVTILHEVSHHRHPDWSESQVESEAESLADGVKQYLGGSKDASGKTNLFFAKATKLHLTPLVSCDVADTYQKQVVGLQSYSSLRPESGLLFTYASPQPLTFWMGKVSFPIDIIFADQNNQIVKIYRNCRPNSSDLFMCNNASKVIEVVGSFCAFHDINVGDHVFYADDKDESFTKLVLESIKEAKIAQQKDLDMMDWNIKIVMKKQPDSRRFLKVSWSPEDYKLKKADIFVNPNPELIRKAMKEMPLEKLVRHALLHILAGAKNELPEDKEQRLITDKLY